MGYLEMPSGIANFSRAVISVWFRLPQDSIDAAKAFFDADITGIPLSGIIPLIILGKKGQSQGVILGHPATEGDPGAEVVGTYLHHWMVPEAADPVTGYDNNTGYPIVIKEVWTSTTTSGGVRDLNPSCIGIDCTGSSPILYINLETGDQPTVAWRFFDETEFTSGDTWIYTPNTAVDTTGLHFVPHGAIPDVTRSQTMTDASMVGFTTAAYSATAAPTFESEKWYHLLVSFDLSTACQTHGTTTTANDSGPIGSPHSVKDGTDSAPRIWVALDDTNQTGSNLSPYWPPGASDPNIVLTPEAYDVATRMNVTGGIAHRENLPADPNGDTQPWTITNTVSVGTPSYAVGPSSIPSSGFALGAPGHTEFADIIQKVDVADFQVFTDVSLDTGVESNRRAFISTSKKPVSPTAAAALLGKPPEIFYQTTSDWTTGTNRGTGGNATKTGTVNVFTPAP